MQGNICNWRIMRSFWGGDRTNCKGLWGSIEEQLAEIMPE